MPSSGQRCRVWIARPSAPHAARLRRARKMLARFVTICISGGKAPPGADRASGGDNVRSLTCPSDTIDRISCGCGVRALPARQRIGQDHALSHRQGARAHTVDPPFKAERDRTVGTEQVAQFAAGQGVVAIDRSHENIRREFSLSVQAPIQEYVLPCRAHAAERQGSAGNADHVRAHGPSAA